MKESAQPWSESEVREVIRLFADTADQQIGLEGRGVFLLDGLAKMIGADRWESQKRRGKMPLASTGIELDDHAPESGPYQKFQWDSEGFIWTAYRFSADPFTENEKHIARTIISNVRWLTTNPLAAPGATMLCRPAGNYPPRLAQTLHGLLAGLSRKEIASGMGVSVNTIAGYVKQVYRLAGVTSHSMLLNQYPSQLGNARQDHS